MENLISPITSEFSLFRNALIMSLMCGVIYPMTGFFFLVRRWLFLAVALPHVAMAGVALGLLISSFIVPIVKDSYIKTLIIVTPFLLTLSTLILLAFFENKDSMSEARIGIIYTVSFACSLLFISKNPWSQSHIMERLRGDLITVTSTEIVIALIIYLIAAGCIMFFRRDFLLISFDPDLAKITGKKITFWNLFLFVIIGSVIAVGVVMTGPLVIFSLLLFPVVTIRTFFCGMNKIVFISVILGLSCTATGFLVSLHPYFDTPLGPTISIVTAALCSVVFFIMKLMNR